MDEVVSQLSDNVALPAVDSSFLLITEGLLYERAMRREKNNSYSSWGGGFSGGGGGGGIR